MISAEGDDALQIGISAVFGEVNIRRATVAFRRLTVYLQLRTDAQLFGTGAFHGVGCIPEGSFLCGFIIFYFCELHEQTQNEKHHRIHRHDEYSVETRRFHKEKSSSCARYYYVVYTIPQNFSIENKKDVNPI